MLPTTEYPGSISPTAIGTIALVAVGGRYLLRYVLRFMARFGTHEVFTATTLLTVVGAGAG